MYFSNLITPKGMLSCVDLSYGTFYTNAHVSPAAAREEARVMNVIVEFKGKRKKQNIKCDWKSLFYNAKYGSP